MPSKSKAQQRLFGMAYAAKKNKTPSKDLSPSIRNIVKSMSKSKIKEFAKTKSSKLPNKVKVIDESNDGAINSKKTTSLNLKQYKTKQASYMSNEEFLKFLASQKQIVKQAFITADELNKQAGAMPPPPPGGAPMPPMDPAAMGGGAMPPVDPNTGMPMDPSMTGGAPANGGAAPEGPSPDEVVDMLDSMSQAMSQFENDINAAKEEVQTLRVEVSKMQGTMETILNILNKGSAGAPKPASTPIPAAPVM